jgi:hypothetical protein
MRVVLLGDSIFDNGAYVGGGPDVVTQLRKNLPEPSQASLLAVDGSVISDIPHQLRHLPRDSTHLVISIGGNDALANAGVLDEPSTSVAETLSRLAAIRDRFRSDYAEAVRSVLEVGLPTALCTIYEPRFPELARQRLAATALSVLNDGIIREAVLRGCPLLDLRLICDEDRDFANSIEPSVQGGSKISSAIASLVVNHDFGNRRTEIFTN